MSCESPFLPPTFSALAPLSQHCPPPGSLLKTSHTSCKVGLTPLQPQELGALNEAAKLPAWCRACLERSTESRPRPPRLGLWQEGVVARWQDGGTLLALPSMQVHGRLAQQLGGALGASGGSSPALIPVFRIPGQAWQPFGTELFVHSMATERAFVPTREEKTTKAIMCLLAGRHSLERETSVSKKPALPKRLQPADVVTQPRNWGAGWSELPWVWQGVHHTHSTHTHTHTQTQKQLLARLAGS